MDDGMEEKEMRRFKGVLLAGILMLGMSAPVYADRSAVVRVEPPAESTDYYMTVDSGGIGVDIYPSTDGKSEKMNDKTVKDGTVLHIEGETEKNGETWGYTEYNGRHGYVPLDELRPSKDAELAAAGTDTGAAQTSNGNSNGTAMSNAADKVNGTPATDRNAAQDGANDAEGQDINAADTDRQDTDASDAQDSSEGEVQGPPEASGPVKASSDEAAENDEEKTEKPVNGTAATSFKEENSWYKSPFIWIGIVTVLAVIGILGYHVKKR